MHGVAVRPLHDAIDFGLRCEPDAELNDLTAATKPLNNRMLIERRGHGCQHFVNPATVRNFCDDPMRYLHDVTLLGLVCRYSLPGVGTQVKGTT